MSDTAGQAMSSGAHSDSMSAGPYDIVVDQHRFSLKFDNNALERRFMDEFTDIFCQGAAVLGFAAMVVVLIQALPEDVELLWRCIIAMTVLCLIVAFGILCGASVMTRILHSMNPYTRERIAVVSIVLMSFTVAGLPQLDNPVAAWDAEYVFYDTHLVLTLAGMVLASHLLLPIRWISLLPLELLLGGLHPAAALLSGAPVAGHLDWWVAWLHHLVFLACAALGRRALERLQREHFARYVLQTRRLAGRELRIAELEEEFDRAILGSLDEQQPQVPTSDPNFRPETTLSGKAFSGIYDRAPPIRVLRRVMALGRREQWSVDSREVAIGNEKLGAGSYGSVVGGEFHGSPVAVKCRIFSRSGSAADSEAKVVSFLNETRILRRVRHPNIVLLYGACVDVVNQDMSLVFERVHGITLEHIVKKGDLHNEPLSMDDRLRAMVDLCRALRYLHSRSPPIVHGDLKACNIMAETTPGATSFHRLKLLDFGLARVLTRNALPLGGTPLWMAPEVVLHPDGPPHERADIFSLGRVAFFTLTGIVALEGTSRRTIARLIQSGSLPELPWPDAVNSTLEDCRPWVELCTEFMPRLRPSIQEVGDFFDKASGLGCTPCSRESSPATSVRTASPTRLRQEEDEAGRAATLPALPGNSQSRGGAPPRQVPDERRAVSMPYLPTKLGRPQVQEECRATSPNKKLRKAFTLDMAEEASRFIADKTTYRKAWTVGFCEPLRSVGPCEIQPASKRATAASAEEQSADGLAEATKVLPGVVNASLSIVPEG